MFLKVFIEDLSKNISSKTIILNISISDFFSYFNILLYSSYSYLYSKIFSYNSFKSPSSKLS